MLKFHVWNLKLVKLQCKIVTLNFIQLHSNSTQSKLSIILTLMNMNFEKLEFDDSKSQLNQEIFNSNENSIDVSTQTLWKQVEINDKFASQVLKTFRNETRHHSKISFAKCENRDNSLYFRDKKYVFNSNRFRLRVIQFAHDSIVDEHFEKVKCYDLINRVYWWFNFYKYIQRFVRNCHVCTRFKSSRQRTQNWLRFFLVSQRRWRDVFMNYVSSFLVNIFMNVIYRYILIFVDRFIKMRHLVSIVIMKIEKAIDAFYAHVWKHHDLFEFFVFDKDTQFIFDVWNYLCQMLKIDVKLFIAYHFEIDDQTKRFNVVMKHYFRVFVNYMQDDWVKWVLDVEFFVNNVSFSIILISFFLINSSQNFRLNFKSSKSLSFDIITQSKIKLIDVEKFINKMKEFIEHFRDEMFIAQVIYEINVNRSRRSCLKYLVENQMWLNVKNLNIARFVVKLNDRHVDLFLVKRVFDKNFLIVELKFSHFMKIHFVVHAILLSHVVAR